MRFSQLVLAGLFVLLSMSTVGAATFRFADQGDPLSMDPHSANESLQLNFTGNIYEPLVGRGKMLEPTPILATRWRVIDPITWRFELRRNVKFHDGSPFTADDVIFSLARAKAESSDVKGHVAGIKEIRKIDTYTIDIITTDPFPILPDSLGSWYMMSKAWCEKNNATDPVDVRKHKENVAALKSNGTGPFQLKSRQPGVRTEFVVNPNYWDKIDSNITEAIFTPIGNDATRVAALVSGDIDMMQPVPVQDLQRLAAHPNLKVMQGPELRTIFIGMDQARNELLYSNVKGKNPFRDQRVRQALYQAIDIEALKTRTMRGAAVPTNLLVAPGITGFAPELNVRLPYDLAAAKKLLTAAGYPKGFEVGMNCPNDRYVNDAEICQAIAVMLSKIDVKVNLESETKVTYFPKVLARKTSFYLLGWTPSTYDSHNPLLQLMMTPAEQGAQGLFNIGGYSNWRVDQLTRQIGTEVDMKRRNALIAEAFKVHADEIGHLPLHQQMLAWGMKKNIDVVQLADNYNWLKWVVVH
jgi:peptide/nickel transport system substrate-binding protein